jgi:murein DD-endopeptidase MepM/ murein hydrolase activator NlpD
MSEMRADGAGAKDAAKESSSMADTLLERAWAWLHATFPERQVYIRSDGRVQFFTFGATLQATCAGLSLIFLGWVAFASVNVIFKDRIIAAKNHRYQQMQATYENRVADQQVSYDELNTALISAVDHFKVRADELQRKQDIVSKLLGRKEQVDRTLTSISGGAQLKAAPDDLPRVSASASSADDSEDVGVTTNAGSGDGDDVSPPSKGASQLNVMPQNAAPQPRTGKPTKASFLEGAFKKFSAIFYFARRPRRRSNVANQPAFRILAAQSNRIDRMSGSETALLEGVDHQITGRISDLQALLTRVGVDPNAMEQKAEGAMGGPLVPIEAVHIEGIADQAFTNAYEGIGAHANELDALFAALRHVPLTTPVHGASFEQTSGFGARVDPFTHHVSFHPGLDFAGPWGSTVSSTAPGVVDWAGPRGGYGNMVEIDHGYGFKTRYGHLSSVLVRVGAKVQKGSPIGKLGSTGRSTGPHVHYEVWSGNVVRNPRKFIEAGRNVLE